MQARNCKKGMTEGREWFETLIGETVCEVRDLQDKSLAPIGARVAQVRENAKLARTALQGCVGRHTYLSLPQIQNTLYLSDMVIETNDGWRLF